MGVSSEPVRRSENNTYPIVESDTVDATVPRRSVDPKFESNPFDPDAACETRVHDVLVPQQFQDGNTSAPPTTRRPVPKRAIKEGMTGARCSTRQPSKAILNIQGRDNGRGTTRQPSKAILNIRE
jgi:hypothetical protein